MSARPAPRSPLEEHDPERARALKAKVRDRVSDVRRHLVALRTAMAEFGEDFDLDAFRVVHAYATATAEQVHEAARLVADEFIPFYDASRTWIVRGFAARPPPR